MKRFAKRLLWAVLAVVLGWMTMGIGLRRSVKAVWKDTPLSHRTSYSAAIRAEAISAVEQIGKSGRSRDLAAWLAEVAAEKSVERLLADVDAARTMPAGWRIFATRIALERLADVDAAAALDFALLRLGEPSIGWTALANALRLRAADNPEQLRPFLLAAAIQLCNGSGGVAEMARLRPRECLGAILRLHLPLHLSGVSEAFNACAGANPLAVLEARPDLPPDVRRQFLLSWSFTDPAGALVWMHAHPADADERTKRSAVADDAAMFERRSDGGEVAHVPDAGGVIVWGNTPRRDGGEGSIVTRRNGIACESNAQRTRRGRLDSTEMGVSHTLVSSDVLIGSTAFAGSFFGGDLDEVIIFSTPLNATQIAGMAAATRLQAAPFPSTLVPSTALPIPDPGSSTWTSVHARLTGYPLDSIAKADDLMALTAPGLQQTSVTNMLSAGFTDPGGPTVAPPPVGVPPACCTRSCGAPDFLN